MRKILLLAAVFVAAPAFSQLYRGHPSQSSMYGEGVTESNQQVSGYMRNNGTYVEPYHRTEADSNSYNNYSAPIPTPAKPSTRIWDTEIQIRRAECGTLHCNRVHAWC